MACLLAQHGAALGHVHFSIEKFYALLVPLSRLAEAIPGSEPLLCRECPNLSVDVCKLLLEFRKVSPILQRTVLRTSLFLPVSFAVQGYVRQFAEPVLGRARIDAALDSLPPGIEVGLSRVHLIREFSKFLYRVLGFRAAEQPVHEARSRRCCQWKKLHATVLIHDGLLGRDDLHEIVRHWRASISGRFSRG